MNTIQIIIIVIGLITIMAVIKLGRFKSNKLGSRRYAIKGNDSVVIVYKKGIYLDKEKVELFFSDIASIGSNTYSSTETKGRSVVGRAVVGGVLAGGVGAVVGGMSGLKDKTIKHFSETVFIETKNSVRYVFETSDGAYRLISDINSKINSHSKEINIGEKSKYKSSTPLEDAERIKQLRAITNTNQKIVCSCGSRNHLHFKYCRVCGTKIDMTSMSVIKDGQNFEYQKCPNCNDLTPKFSNKTKFCSLCGIEAKF